MTVQQGYELAVEALKSFLGEEYSEERIDAAYIDAATKEVKKF